MSCQNLERVCWSHCLTLMYNKLSSAIWITIMWIHDYSIKLYILSVLWSTYISFLWCTWIVNKCLAGTDIGAKEIAPVYCAKHLNYIKTVKRNFHILLKFVSDLHRDSLSNTCQGWGMFMLIWSLLLSSTFIRPKKIVCFRSSAHGKIG